MHVLVAAHDLYPDPGSGGTGRFVYETGRRLVERGHEVTVVTRRRGHVPATGTIEGMQVRRYDLTIAERAWPSIARQLPGALATVRDHVAEVPTVDVVSFQATVTEPIVHRLLPDEVPRTAVFHSPWPVEFAIKADHRGDPSGWRRRLNVAVRARLERSVLAACRSVVTLSAFMADELCAEHGDVADPSVVPGGVDAEVFAPDGAEASRLATAEPAFLTVRRLSPRMGHEALLRAFAEVSTSHPGAELFVAGDGPLRRDLEQAADELGVADRVAFLGHVPDEQLPGLHASADVFVLPTQRLEGFGLATLEALASGTPVVGTPVGATPEVLAPLADRLPAPMVARSRGADALAEAMRAWAKLDAGQRAKAGEACRRFAAREHTWERTTEALERELQAACGAG